MLRTTGSIIAVAVHSPNGQCVASYLIKQPCIRKLYFVKRFFSKLQVVLGCSAFVCVCIMVKVRPRWSLIGCHLISKTETLGSMLHVLCILLVKRTIGNGTCKCYTTRTSVNYFSCCFQNSKIGQIVNLFVLHVTLLLH